MQQEFRRHVYGEGISQDVQVELTSPCEAHPSNPTNICSAAAPTNAVLCIKREWHGTRTSTQVTWVNLMRRPAVCTEELFVSAEELGTKTVLSLCLFLSFLCLCLSIS